MNQEVKVFKFSCICSLIQIVLSSICLVYSIMHQKGIIIWILLLVSGLFFFIIARNHLKQYK